MDERCGQAGDGMEEVVFCTDGDLVGLDGGDVGVGDDFVLGTEVVDPAQADLPGVQNSRGEMQGLLGLAGEGGVDGVHEAPVDLAGGLAQDGQDGHGDEQSGGWVGQLQPSATPPAPASKAREVSPSVRACSPSASSAAEPILRPARIRHPATTSLPVNPISAAAATAIRSDTGCGWTRRLIAS